MKLYRPLILASKSPRRQDILNMAGIPFKVQVQDVPEIWPDNLEIIQIPQFLSQLKANAFLELSESHDILTADTIVVIDNEVLNKPIDYQDAFKMLQKLSGKTHSVISGVTILRDKIPHSFYCKTDVTFRVLSHQQIDHYITHYQPFDKAGSYGIQDWMGVVAVTEIKGDFYNVMGLPLAIFYDFIVL